jgi:hypothetical protein
VDGRTWKLETASAEWSPLGLILGVVFRDRMWVIGGGTYDVRTYLNDVWCSNDGVHWEQVVDMRRSVAVPQRHGLRRKIGYCRRPA